jgi:hypothetical protein
MIKVKPRGRIPGGPAVSRDAHTAIVIMDCLWGWTKYDIGKLWGIKPASVRSIVRRWHNV